MSDIAALTARIDALEHALGIEQDINQIRRIQYTYGYFIDKSQYQECLDLFSDEGEVWFLGGVYKGKAGLKRLYIDRFRGTFTNGHNGPRYGWLLDHPTIALPRGSCPIIFSIRPQPSHEPWRDSQNACNLNEF